MPEPTTPRPRGRPMNADVTAAIHAAALTLARQGGIAHATMERIAEVSGAAKTTLYRRWPTAAALVMDAFLDSMSPRLAYDEDGPIAAIMARTLARLADLGASPDGDLLGGLLGAAQTDPDLRAAFRDRWVEPRRQLGRAALQRAIDGGQLSPAADINLILDMLYGAVYYRLFVTFQPLTPAYLTALVSRTFNGLA